MKSTRIAMVQCNPTVGDIAANSEMIKTLITTATEQHNANLIVFPELVLSGYPPDDLLFYDDFHALIQLHLESIALACPSDITVVLGSPLKCDTHIYNAAIVIQNSRISNSYYKTSLPNDGVFNEKRHFTSDSSSCTLTINRISFSLRVCEDVWAQEWPSKNDADVILCLNASPFDKTKHESRQSLLINNSNKSCLPIVYVNLVGGQDELVFDGGSMVVTPEQGVIYQAPFFESGIYCVDISPSKAISLTQPTSSLPSQLDLCYQALCTGLRDYITKNNFSDVIIGLSGGIDSALSLAIAVDALGAEHVHTVMMPSPYTAAMSIEDAEQQSDLLGVTHTTIPITDLMAGTSSALLGAVHSNNISITQQNIQARLRGLILMALANERGAMVLSTSNKSELAVGYSTLYGDMCGGFCVLKDVPKGMVYQLAGYRNQIAPAIPERVLSRPPSAELCHDQFDQDTLPPYELLDQIIEAHIEHGQGHTALIASGFDPVVVDQVLKLIHRHEYKRRQSAPGVKITSKAFGRDRVFPITSRYNSNCDHEQLT